jgi:hypothetical protein
MGLALSHTSGFYNLELPPRFVENLRTSCLTILNYLCRYPINNNTRPAKIKTSST